MVAQPAQNSSPFEVVGQIYNQFSGEIYPGKIHVKHGRISAIERLQTACRRIITSPFGDAHVHTESSLVSVPSYVRLAVRRGVGFAIADPHEIGNVLGLQGVQYMINQAKGLPFNFGWGAPSCVPATIFETAGASIEPHEIELLLQMAEVTHVAEMMNWPGVIAREPRLMKIIELARKYKKAIDAHGASLRGTQARDYNLTLGPNAADHECVSADEAREKLEHGAIIAIRRGSAANDFDALIELLREHPERIFFCADDGHPDFLMDGWGDVTNTGGYIDSMVRRAIAMEIDPMTVFRAASRNAIEHYRIPMGRLNVGDWADFIVLEDLQSCTVTQHYHHGQLLADNGNCLLDHVAVTPINNFNCDPIAESELKVPFQPGRMRAIELHSGKLITTESIVDAHVVGGYAEADPSRDLLKLVVKNRYQQAPLAISFVIGFMLRRGAIASSVAHDSHNIVAAGTNDRDIARAINLVVQHKGALVLVDGSFELVLPLPIAGLMSDLDAFEVANRYRELDRVAKQQLGSTLPAPFMALSFLALLVIPFLKLSDRGLFDCIRFEFTHLTA